MPLIGPKEMFAAAYAGRYAVGAFNVNNMEIVQGIMQAASEEKSPVILQVSSGARSYAGQKYLMKLVEAALAEDPSVPWWCIWTTAPASSCAATVSTAVSPP